MERGANVNVKDFSFGKNINVKEGEKSRKESSARQRLLALQHAQHLQQKFGKPAFGSLAFLRKCFNRMSEERVWDLYARATKPGTGIMNPFAYFIASAKAQPEMKDPV